MKSASFIMPAVFCGIVAFPCLLAAAVREHNWPQALFCACLPGCFVVLAASLTRMNREISRLRRRVARLEGHGAPANHSHPAAAPAGADACQDARADAPVVS